MQMVIGCGREISGMAKNHIKTNIVGWQFAVKCCFKPHVTSGTTKTVVPNRSENSGSTPTPCLDKAVLAQGGGGVRNNAAQHTWQRSQTSQPDPILRPLVHRSPWRPWNGFGKLCSNVQLQG